MVRSEVAADESLAAMRAWIKLGIAIAAMIRMIATTIRSSISEKPFRFTRRGPLSLMSVIIVALLFGLLPFEVRGVRSAPRLESLAYCKALLALVGVEPSSV